MDKKSKTYVSYIFIHLNVVGLETICNESKREVTFATVCAYHF